MEGQCREEGEEEGWEEGGSDVWGGSEEEGEEDWVCHLVKPPGSRTAQVLHLTRRTLV